MEVRAIQLRILQMGYFMKLWKWMKWLRIIFISLLF
jgi:hypothetical protein